MVQNVFLKLYGRNKTSIVGNCYYDLSEKKIYFGCTASVSGVYNGMILFLNDHYYFYVPAFSQSMAKYRAAVIRGLEKRTERQIYNIPWASVHE